MESAGGQGSPIDEQLLDSHYQAWSTFLSRIPSVALRCALQLRIPDASGSGDDHDHDHDRLSLAPFFLFVSDPLQQEHHFHLADWFRGPHFSAYETAHGVGVNEHLEKHPEATTAAIQANASNSDAEMRGLIKHLIPKLEGFETLVDVGGGSGAVAGIIAEAVPQLKCSVFDLPEVVAQAKHRDNVTFMAGDAFEFIPSADVIFFKGTMTNFSDEKGVNILKRCRQAIQGCKNGGKVLMVEKVANQRRPTFESTKIQLCYDLHVMTYGGEERNETEWKKLILDAGFMSYKITQTPSINSIIEVFP